MKWKLIYRLVVLAFATTALYWGIMGLMLFAKSFMFPFLDTFIYERILIGALIGSFSQIRYNLFERKWFSLMPRFAQGALIGAVVGFVVGSMIQGLSFVTLFLSSNDLFILSWFLLGGGLGLFLNKPVSLKKNWKFAIQGALAAAMSPLFFLFYLDADSSIVSSILPVFLLFTFLHLPSVLSNRSYLRILNGHDVWQSFPLEKPKTSLGYLQSNDIPLKSYSEIFPTHAYIMKTQNQKYQILNTRQDSQLFINFRPIQESLLKSGDIIKIGSAVLQYWEEK